jgi:two-component system KDP operon response regulator KdpE
VGHGLMGSVLVVDDEPDILLMLRVALEASGHDTVLAPDGEAGLLRLKEQHVDCVLLDVMMPVMDGWGVLDGVAKLADPPPVVVISARSEARDVRRALGAGAVDYVTKPFSLPKLVELVEEVADLDADGIAAHRAKRLAGVDG